jgi:hypothetical protein
MKKQTAVTEVYDQILHKVNTTHGAPMGRSDIGTKQDAKGKRIYRRRVYLFCDGYDKGDAYWGCGAPLYVEYTLDKSYVAFFRKE